MRLLFEEITGRADRYTINDSCWFPDGNEDFSLNASANISVSRRDSETVLLEGKIEGRCLTGCDRCGEQVTENLHCEFMYLVTTRKEQALELREIECSDEDAITLYLREQEIDVDEILREQTYLALPLRTLCSEDCKGICAGCGVDLNDEDCRCSLDESNSAFAVLKKLTNR
jgi:uncharacterized protein